MKRNKNIDTIDNALLNALNDMTNGKSIFDAFLSKKSKMRKYIKSVSFKGTTKVSIPK